MRCFYSSFFQLPRANSKFEQLNIEWSLEVKIVNCATQPHGQRNLICFWNVAKHLTLILMYVCFYRTRFRATLTLLSCSLNFPRAFITRYTHAKHGPSLYYYMRLTHVEVLQYMKAEHIAQFFLSGIDRKSHFFVLQSSACSNWKALTKSAMTGAVERIFKVSDFAANGRYFLVLILIMLLFF